MPYSNPEPCEVIKAPATLWLAPVGTEFPGRDVADAEVPAPWQLVGKRGAINYSREGVTVSKPGSYEEWKGAGSNMASKVWRTSDGLVISLAVADLTLETLQLQLNGNAISEEEAGPAASGAKTIGLSRGQTVTEYALLVRGPSPYLDGRVGQYKIPRVYVAGEPEIVYGPEGDPAAVALEFHALQDLTATDATQYAGSLEAIHEEETT